MNQNGNDRLAHTVQQRTGVGPTEIVAGWQGFLVEMLEKMKPFLMPGALITFRTLTSHESSFFGRLREETAVPQSVAAFYLPPSVRHQMMGGDPDRFEQDRQVDAGALVASRPGNYTTIVNALFARSPYTPAVDVYENGQLIAGYQFADIDTCVAEINSILERHLAGPPAMPETREEKE